MKIQFKTSPCVVPVEALIEDYQHLNLAYQALKSGRLDEDVLDEISTVLQCLATAIESGTQPIGDIHPTVSSLIAMSCGTGVILTEDGKDIKCADGRSVSGRTYDGVAQCDQSCIHFETCQPEEGRILLECGHLYTGASVEQEDLLEALDKQ